MNKVEATMQLVRETKGAVLYQNVREGIGEAVTNIYLRKSGLDGSPYPETIHITIDLECGRQED